MRHRVLLWSPGRPGTYDYLVSVFKEVGLLLHPAAFCTFNVCIPPLYPFRLVFLSRQKEQLT